MLRKSRGSSGDGRRSPGRAERHWLTRPELAPQEDSSDDWTAFEAVRSVENEELIRFQLLLDRIRSKALVETCTEHAGTHTTLALHQVGVNFQERIVRD